ncbi:potassium channel family protein, partial [Nocardioides luteus]
MTRVQMWERRTEIPLLLLAIAFLVAYAWPIVDPRLNRTLEETLTVVFWTVWGAFCLDFLIRVLLADRRGHYLLHHWYDVALIGLPVLRPLRILRVLAFARLLSRSAARTIVGQTTLYVVGLTIIAVFLGALAVLDAERAAADGNIKTLGDAVWWACTTVTTVGYGDHYPVTTNGRLVAVALMVVGIALVGSVTAAVATWFIQHAQAESDAV